MSRHTGETRKKNCEEGDRDGEEKTESGESKRAGGVFRLATPLLKAMAKSITLSAYCLKRLFITCNINIGTAATRENTALAAKIARTPTLLQK